MSQRPRRKPYRDLLAQLSRQSVRKHYDAYSDIDWDAPEMAVHPHDPRWCLNSRDPLGGTVWYQGLPESKRAEIGLHFLVAQMKTGVAFENILSRGLLEMAASLEDNAPEFRYALHEVIEESQHSLMFQEFINRSSLKAPGLEGFEALAARRIPALGRSFPELFFLFVLGGEEPIDYSQRQSLKHDQELHPLLERIMRIHVTEEARHLCFAKAFLREHVDRLNPLKTWHLRIRAPIMFAIQARQMLEAPKVVVDAHDIPPSVVAEAYADNHAHRVEISRSLANIRSLCQELRIVTPATRWVWEKLGVWHIEPETKLLPSGA